jgi:hypothetical protein
MAIYLKDKKITPYRGDYKPVNIYQGAQKIAGWRVDEKSGTSIEWSDTYNDKVVSAVVEGKSEQVVTVQGKNLFDVTKNDGYVFLNKYSIKKTGSHTFLSSSELQITSSEANTGLAFLYKAQPSTAYYVSFDLANVNASSALGYILFLDENKAQLREEYYLYNASTTYSSRTVNAVTQSGEHYIVIVTGCGGTAGTVKFKNIQLELGSVATPYEPFVPNSPSPDYPSPIISAGEVSGIDLSVTGNAGQSYQVHRDIILRSLPDGTCDTWDAVTGTVTRRVGLKVFDGTEFIRRNNDHNYCTAQIFTSTSYRVVCTHFKSTDTYIAIGFDDRANTYVPDSRIYFQPALAYTTAAAFQAWLAAQHAAGTPVTVYYKLATPTTEQIDPAPLPTYPRYTALNCNAEVTATCKTKEV